VGPVDLAALIAQKDELIADMWQHKYVDLADHYGFEIIHELARFKDRDTLAVGRRGLQATLNVVATGADPAIPSVSGVREAGYLTSTTAVEQASVPKRLITIGGGFVGLEQSRLFARLGADATIIGRLAPWAEPELASRPRHILMDEGIRVINARATSVEVHGDTRVVHTNRETASEDDAIMVATDRQARIDARDLTAAGFELDNRGSSKSLISSAHPTTGSSRPATSPVVRSSLISSAMTLRSLLRAFLVVSLVAVSALVATVAPPLAAVAGAATESCATPVTSAPAGPATVSAASTAYGQVLVVGSGATSGGLA
jgi:hypothetical protein